MKKLYKFKYSPGYGTLTGIFVAESADIDDAIGLDVYLGSALGKHSDIVFELTSDMISICTEDQKFIARFEALGCESGYNPLDYISDEEWDAEDEDEDDEDDLER
jgi:hypothetical protein